MTTNQHRGIFVVLEGLDRSGKTTQLEALHNYIDSTSLNKSHMYRFPDRTTPIGKIIDRYLKNEIDIPNHLIHDLFSDNRWEAVDSIVDTLINKKMDVVCDRYAYSGVAFTMAKKIYELNLDACMHSDVGLPRPDVVIFLDIDSKTQVTRGGFGNERYEDVKIQTDARDIFIQLKNKDVTGTWRVVDARKSPTEISEEIIKIVDESRLKVQNAPLMKLWSVGEFMIGQHN
jgi:dTMP kinase